MNSREVIKLIELVAVAVILLFVAGVLYVSLPRYLSTDEQIFCTQDAKICPDGSAVGRTGPKCEFAACPGERNTEWKATYVQPVSWPPHIATSSAAFTCSVGGLEIGAMGKTEKRTIDNRNYCVTTKSEGAAGSTYTDYVYVTEQHPGIVRLLFTLRAIQCGNYDTQRKAMCESERQSLNVDGIVNNIVRAQ